MSSHASKSTENKSDTLIVAQAKNDEAFSFADQRPETAQLMAIQQMANNSWQIQQARQLQTVIQRKPNNTGLPDNLKSGIENLSGYSMDDVKVHYNSAQPAGLQAHAYAQGTDIHIAPGQEQHLPHEAWHVVQQKQGRVQPTTQLQKGVGINNDDALEKEADVYGQKALQLMTESTVPIPLKSSSATAVLQLAHERLAVLGGTYITNEAEEDDMIADKTGILAELMIPLRDEGVANVGIDKARQKILQLEGQDDMPIKVALIIGLNAVNTIADVDNQLDLASQAIIDFANDYDVPCAVVPMKWKMPDKKGGYVFPFIEARHALGVHATNATLLKRLESHSETIFHRTIDVDVSNDPLLGRPVAMKKQPGPRGKYVADETPGQRAGRLAGRKKSQKRLNKVLTDKNNTGKIITGGYLWDTTGIEDATLSTVITHVNTVEQSLRLRISKKFPQTIYSPEPNTYIPDYHKGAWNIGLKGGLSDESSYRVQMGESTFGRKGLGVDNLNQFVQDSSISTTKPRKAWLDNFAVMVEVLKTGVRKDAWLIFNEFIKEIHQSYLNKDIPEKIALKQGAPLDKPAKDELEKLVKSAHNTLWGKFVKSFALH